MNCIYCNNECQFAKHSYTCYNHKYVIDFYQLDGYINEIEITYSDGNKDFSLIIMPFFHPSFQIIDFKRGISIFESDAIPTFLMSIESIENEIRNLLLL